MNANSDTLDTSNIYVPDSDVLNMTIVDSDGNVLAVKSIKARSINVPAGAYVIWH